MFLWLGSLGSTFWVVFCLIMAYLVFVVLDNTVSKFGSFCAFATFHSTDAHQVPLHFDITFAIERETYNKVFKRKYKQQAKERIIQYLWNYAMEHSLYSDSDLQNTKIRSAIRSDIIKRFDLEGLVLIKVLDAESQ